MNNEFAGSLKERIIIERPSQARTAMGLQAAGWEDVARCLAAVAPDGAGDEREAMALSAMPRFKVSIRLREGVAIDQRIRWGKRLLMIRQMIDDPRFGDRIVMRCEEVRQ
ncbi:MAG: head-tail adaptor protein [Sphingomicrobium sp.]